MSNYKVESYEIRKRRNGEDYLILTLCGRLVSFFEKVDKTISVNLGDVVSCDVVEKNNYLNGYNLKILSDSTNVSIETAIKISDKVSRAESGNRDKKTRKITNLKNDTFLKAGGRTYYFDIKTTTQGDPFLIVTEERGKNRNTLYVFQDHAEQFLEKVTIALNKILKN